MDESLDAASNEDIKHLCQIFIDVDEEVVRAIYNQYEGDMSECMQALAERVKGPQPSRSMAPVSEQKPPTRPPRDDDDWEEVHQRDKAAPPAASSSSWGSYGYENVGISLTAGLVTMANQLNNWVADLATAFETTWDTGTPETENQTSRSAESSVVSHDKLTDRTLKHRHANLEPPPDLHKEEVADDEVDDDGDEYGKKDD